MAEHEPAAEPSHEAVHLPPPSFLPPIMALAIALILTGLVVNHILLVVGVILAVPALVLWVRDARRQLKELPE